MVARERFQTETQTYNFGVKGKTKIVIKYVKYPFDNICQIMFESVQTLKDCIEETPIGEVKLRVYVSFFRQNWFKKTVLKLANHIAFLDQLLISLLTSRHYT